MESKPHVIIDNSSCYIKGGFSGEYSPRCVFPNCIGFPKDGLDVFIGSEIQDKFSLLEIVNYPIENGVITDWYDMEKIFNHLFTNELEIDPSDYNILLTDLNGSKESKEKMAEIMFETFNSSGFYIVDTGILPLYSQGIFSGMSVHLGSDLITFYPIFDGYIIKESIIKYNFGGNDLTKFMYHLTNKTDLLKHIINQFVNKKSNILTIDKGFISEEVKEKVCYCALNLKEELKTVENYDYELPDGNHIITKEERILCPEALFDPTLINEKESSIAKGCYDSIQKCAISMKKNLYNSIILSGGTSMFKGLPERFEKELKALVQEATQKLIKILASYDRKYSVWIGGSVLASLCKKWITKFEYEESGRSIIDRLNN